MNKHPSNVRKIKHFFLGAGLALVVTFTASSVFAQSLAIPLQGGLMPCGSLGNKMATPAECDAADAAAGVSHIQQAPPNSPCAAGQVPTNERPCMPQFGTQQGGFPQQNFQQNGQQLQSGGPPIDSSTINTAITDRDKIKNDLASGRLQMGQGMNNCMLLGKSYQMSVKDCLQSLDEIIAGKMPSMLSNQQTPQINSQNQQFNQQQTGLPQMQQQPTAQNQQPLFGQQQFNQVQEEQSSVNLVKPTSKMSTNLKKKGINLDDKLLLILNKKFRDAKTENKRLAAVKSVARQASKVWKYVESAYGEIDEDIFDFDSSMADIADALKSRDPDLAYELTQDVLESMKQLLEQ